MQHGESAQASASTSKPVLIEIQAVDGSEGDLYFLPFFKVIVCRPCGFAIQPTGISRHLKEKHRLYRTARRFLLEQIQRYQLAEPADVPYIDLLPAPIPHLPVLKGVSCTVENCDFLCASFKRMKQHWTSVHEKSCQDDELKCEYLQTLFRGNCVRYFKVAQAKFVSSPLNTPSPQTMRQSAVQMAIANRPIQSHNVPPSPSTHPDINMSDLSLLYHYLSITSLTLQRGGPSDYFTNDVPQIGLHHEFLMHNMLSAAAIHLASSLGRDQAEQRQNYVQLAAAHQIQSLPGYRSALTTTNGDFTPVIIAYSKLLIVIRCADFQLTHDIMSDGGNEGVAHANDFDFWNSIISYIRLTRSNTQMAFSVLENQANAQLSWILPRAGYPTRPPPYSESLQLTSLQQAILECNDPKEIREVLLHTLENLKLAFLAALSISPTGSSDALIIWSGRMSSEYVDLLEIGNRHALALLAHFCLLLSNVRDRWWMANHDRILLESLLRVSPTSRSLVEWPYSQIRGHSPSP